MEKNLEALANSFDFDDKTQRVVQDVCGNCDGGGIGGNCDCND